MTDGVCLDSSVLVKLLTPEPGSAAAAEVVAAASDLFVPEFAWAEVGSALRKKVRTGALTLEQADRAWEALSALGLTFVAEAEVRSRAWGLAVEYALPTLYDAAFLAVAELAPGGPCALWTADVRLIDAVGARHRLLRTLGSDEVSPGAGSGGAGGGEPV